MVSLLNYESLLSIFCVSLRASCAKAPFSIKLTICVCVLLHHCVCYPSVTSQAPQGDTCGGLTHQWHHCLARCKKKVNKQPSVGKTSQTQGRLNKHAGSCMKATAWVNFIKVPLSSFQSYVTFIRFVLIQAKSRDNLIKNFTRQSAQNTCMPFKVQYSHIPIKCHGLSVLIVMPLFQPDSFQILKKKKRLNVIIKKPGAKQGGKSTDEDHALRKKTSAQYISEWLRGVFV